MATFSITARMMRCLVGLWPTADAAMRAAICAQCRDTGADLFAVDVDRSVKAWLASNMDTRTICERILACIFPQIRSDGAVLAPPVTLADWKAGARHEAWHRYGYMKQGHAAFVVLCAGYAAGGASGGATSGPYIELMELVAGWIERQQERRLRFVLRGVWPAGEREGDWWGQFAYTTETAPFEDDTQAWNTVAMAATGRRTAVDLALGTGGGGGFCEVVEINGGLVPYNASLRSGLPDFGRFAVLFSTDHMAGLAMLLEDLGDPAPSRAATCAAMIRARLEELRIPTTDGGGEWPRWVDEWGAAHWPEADPSDPNRMRARDPSRLTRDESRSLAGFTGRTQRPRQAMVSLASPVGRG